MSQTSIVPPTGLLERVCEAAVEDQADIIITLGDPPAPRILDCDHRIEVLPQSAADDLECHALTGFHIDGVPVDVGRAGSPQDGHGPAQVLGRPGPSVGFPFRDHGQVVDQKQFDIAQAASGRQTQPVNAEGGISSDLHLERGLIVRLGSTSVATTSFAARDVHKPVAPLSSVPTRVTRLVFPRDSEGGGKIVLRTNRPGLGKHARPQPDHGQQTRSIVDGGHT